jgi:hypothetical protein
MLKQTAKEAFDEISSTVPREIAEHLEITGDVSRVSPKRRHKTALEATQAAA